MFCSIADRESLTLADDPKIFGLMMVSRIEDWFWNVQTDNDQQD